MNQKNTLFAIMFFYNIIYIFLIQVTLKNLVVNILKYFENNIQKYLMEANLCMFDKIYRIFQIRL